MEETKQATQTDNERKEDCGDGSTALSTGDANDKATAGAETMTATKPTDSRGLSEPTQEATEDDKPSEKKTEGSISTVSTSAETSEQDSSQPSPTTAAAGPPSVPPATAPQEETPTGAAQTLSPTATATTTTATTKTAAPSLKSEDEIMADLLRQLADRDSDKIADTEAQEPQEEAAAAASPEAAEVKEEMQMETGKEALATSSLETFGGASSSSSWMGDDFSFELAGISEPPLKRRSLYSNGGGSRRSLYGNTGGLAICGALYPDLAETITTPKAGESQARTSFQPSSPPGRFPAPSTAPNAAPAGCRPEYLPDGSLDLTKYKLPSVVVLDLDDTCWLHHGLDANPKFQPPFSICPKTGGVKDAFGQEVKVVPDLRTILRTLRNYNISIAVASHNGQPAWCRQVMDCVRVDPDTTWGDLMQEELCVIQWEGAYWPMKKQHLEDIRGIVGCEYTEMVLFDDGKNIIFQAWDLGVVAVRCAGMGLTVARFLEAMSWVGFTRPKPAKNGWQGVKRKY